MRLRVQFQDSPDGTYAEHSGTGRSVSPNTAGFPFEILIPKFLRVF
jgi:hypothetical protein